MIYPILIHVLMGEGDFDLSSIKSMIEELVSNEFHLFFLSNIDINLYELFKYSCQTIFNYQPRRIPCGQLMSCGQSMKIDIKVMHHILVKSLKYNTGTVVVLTRH